MNIPKNNLYILSTLCSLARAFLGVQFWDGRGRAVLHPEGSDDHLVPDHFDPKLWIGPGHLELFKVLTEFLLLNFSAVRVHLLNFSAVRVRL